MNFFCPLLLEKATHKILQRATHPPKKDPSIFFWCQRASKSKAETKSFDFIKTKHSDFTQMKCSDKFTLAFPKFSFKEYLAYGGV